MLVECAQRRGLLIELLIGTEEEERRSGNRDQGENDTRPPQHP
jgi:hypothetical protein